MPQLPISPAYGLFMIVGIATSAVLFRRLNTSHDLPVHIYVGGLIGAIVGAKLAYLIAELPFIIAQPDLWLKLLVGRTIIGGLLGGYLGVECGKRAVGYTRPTGDAFAVVCPLGLAFGRVGCFLHGCCLGVECQGAWYSVIDAAGAPRLPASLIEGLFNLVSAAAGYFMLRRRVMPGQLFHIYLATYGVFRFVHEFYRQTPRFMGSASTYQILALVLVIFAVVRFYIRRRPRSVTRGTPVL